MNMHRSQVFLILWLAFLAGIGVGSFWAVSSTTLLILVGISTLILGVSAYHKTFGQTPRGARRRKLGFIVGCLLLVFSLGVWRFNAYNAGHSMVAQFADRAVKDNAQSVVLSGYVDGDFEVTGTRGRFAFHVKEIIVPKRIIFTNERILVRTNALPEFHYGDILRIDGPISVPTNFSDDFDYISYLEKSNIRAIALYPDIEISKLTHPLSSLEHVKSRIYEVLFNARNTFSDAVTRSISEPNAGYINGILLGAKSQLSNTLKTAFQRTGTSHIIALSGYNITIIAEAVMFILLFWLPRRRAFWVTVSCIVLFTIMTGASASVIRAAIMGVLMLFALGYGRLSSITNAVVLAAGVMALANPFVLRFDAGFQLSFAAVLGLIYISPIISYALRRMPQLGGTREIIVATLSAQIAVLPLILYSFKTFSIVSLLANVIILPLMPMAMFLGFTTGIAGLVLGIFGRVIGVATWAITEIQLGVINFLSSLPFAAASVAIPFWGMCILYVLFIACFAFAHWKWRDKLAIA